MCFSVLLDLPWLCRVPRLCGENSLTGAVPDMRQRLGGLSLARNRLEGTIPAALVKQTALMHLQLADMRGV